MWLPCNFGETIRIREHIGYEYEECALIGLTVGLHNGGMTYLFSKLICNHVSRYQSDRLVVMDLKNEISFWPNAFNNSDSYDQSSLNDVQQDRIMTEEEFNSNVSANGKHYVDFNGECILFSSKEQRDWSKFNVKKQKD